MDQAATRKLLESLFSDIPAAEAFHNSKPLLAHYSSISTLELILKHNEIWFSNPLFMNDLDEVRFGINTGSDLFLKSKVLKAACPSADHLEILNEAFNIHYLKFANEHVLDTYVLCLSEHQQGDNDGLLSMWRGYGSNGNGAAIVFDTGKLPPRPGSPLIASQVKYGTREERVSWLKAKIKEFADIIARVQMEREHMGLAAYLFFERLKFFAIFSKHSGFREEREWRVVYMPDRDKDNLLTSSFGYWVGPTGVQPKLKVKVQNLPGANSPGLSFSTIVDRIILGPSVSSPLAKAVVERMFDLLDVGDLKQRLRASSIPFRATANS